MYTYVMYVCIICIYVCMYVCMYVCEYTFCINFGLNGVKCSVIQALLSVVLPVDKVCICFL
jgi:hypothetical protein